MKEIIAETYEGTKSSSDSGTNWGNFSNNFCSIIKDDERFIGASANGLGLFYSDDNGENWTQSSVSSGSWCNLFKYGSFIYASSSDGNGIVRTSTSFSRVEASDSFDSSKAYYVYADGTYARALISSFESGVSYYYKNAGIEWSSIKNNGSYYSSAVYEKGSTIKIYFGGDDLFIYDLSTGAVYAGKTVIGKGNSSVSVSYRDMISFPQLSQRILTSDEIDGILIIIINKVVYPMLCNKIFGTDGFIDSTGYVTLKNGDQKVLVYGADDVYKIYKYTSIIDWENDVGMRSFGDISISDLVNSDSVDDIALNDINEYSTNSNEKLSSLLKKLSSYITFRKDKTYAYLSNLITSSTDESTVSEIQDASSSNDMLANNLKAFNIFNDSAKGTALVLASKMLDEIYTFDEPMMKNVLNAAMYETIRSSAGMIRLRLIELNSELAGGSTVYRIDPDKYFFKYDFYSGLERAFDCYLDSMSRNIKVLDDTGDKDLISLAASFYKQSEKYDLVQKVNGILSTTSVGSNSVADSTQERLDSLTESIKSYLLSNLSASADVKKAGIDSLINSFSTDVSSNMEKAIKIYFFNYYYNFSSRINSEIVFSSFDSYLTSLGDHSYEEKKRCYGYLDEIHEKFLDRCSELLKFMYEHFPSLDEYSSDSSESVRIKLENTIEKFRSSIESDDIISLMSNETYVRIYFIENTMGIKDAYEKEGEKFTGYIASSFENNESII